ncbi:hypothetical protein [Arthrobacter humicola]
MHASIAATVALAVFTLLASATIGWLYVPALAAALASAVAPARKAVASAVGEPGWQPIGAVN